MSSGKYDITNGPIVKQILMFFFPILLGTFFQQLYNTADALIVGNYVGTLALGAVGGSSAQIINLLIGLFVGISTGSAVLISQFYGAHDGEKVYKTIQTSMVISIVGGIILMIVGIVFSKQMLEMMNTPQELMAFSQTYLNVYFLGTIPSLIYNMGSGIIRSMGDSKRPLYFLIVACLVNIMLDVVFVVFFNMQVLGAALATIISQFISAVLVIYALSSRYDAYSLNMKKLFIDNEIIKNIIYIGVPTGVNSVFYSLSNILIQTSINGFGAITVAAYTAYGKIDVIYWMTISAFGVAIMTFVGQNFGANKLDRIKKGVHATMGLALVATLIITSILLLGGNFIFELFTKDQEVIRIGMDILRQLVPYYIAFICIEIYSGAVRATGDTIIPTIITSLGVVGVRIVWLLMFTHQSVADVLLVYPISWISTSIIYIGYYYHGGWLKRQLVKRDKMLNKSDMA
ncbi:MAG: MATE family efflux transporter [Erysipelotrichaceae bacterium]|nr:MATE family efflux transporter [Erysipelotrichaceae bacterium]MDY5252169.1 MATE family efflux transporter [Erysipelotrichaceae bacterium]